jgi:hypothetical protein
MAKRIENRVDGDEMPGLAEAFNIIQIMADLC